jgi:DNA-binding MarR family transcriptional regulator
LPPISSSADDGEYLERVHEAARVRAALRRFEADTSTVVRRCRLTPQRYLLLLMIRAAPADGRETGPTITNVAERLAMPHNTVSELIARAVEAGLVKRSRGALDRRSQQLSLTADGERRLRCALDGLADQRAALRRSLAAPQRLQ